MQGFYGRGARAILSLASLAQDDEQGSLRSHPDDKTSA